MNHTELQWQTGDGLAIYGQSWEPETPPRAVVCLVHGLGEHSGRYAHVAQALSDAGFAMLGFDHRGHGKSEGPRGHIPHDDAFLEDIDILLAQAESRYSGLPRFLYGHSMGGSAVLAYGIRRQPDLAGVIATSPGLRPGFKVPKTMLLLGRLMKLLRPGFIQPNGLELEALSRDPAVIQAYVDDPLVHDRISARLMMWLVAGGQWILDHAAEFRLPLLLMHGSADRITSAAASQEFAAAAPNCTLKIWEGLYHETHNEPEQAQVIAAMIEWLEGQLQTL